MSACYDIIITASCVVRVEAAPDAESAKALALKEAYPGDFTINGASAYKPRETDARRKKYTITCQPNP